VKWKAGNVILGYFIFVWISGSKFILGQPELFLCKQGQYS
jgi:hypothetical protein